MEPFRRPVLNPEFLGRVVELVIWGTCGGVPLCKILPRPDGVPAGEEAESGGGLSQGLPAHVPSGLSRRGWRIVKFRAFNMGALINCLE